MVKKFLYIAGVILVVGVIALSLRVMIISTYASQIENSLTIWISSFISLAVFYVFNVKYGRLSSSLFTLFALLLTILNAAAMPLLLFTSAFSHDEVEYTSNTVFINTLATVVFAVLVHLGMVVIEDISKSEKGRKTIFFSITGMSVLTVLLIIIFGDLLSGTSIVQIGSSFSFQIAIPVLILTIAQTGLGWKEKGKLRVLYFIEAVIINLSLVLMGETGIPIIECIAFAIFYYLLQKKKIKVFSYGIPITAFLGMTAIFTIHALQGKLSSIPLLGGISDKVEARIFSDSVDQINMCLRSISAGGVFGSSAYNQYLPEASSDFAFAAIVHYTGFFAGAAVITVFFGFATSGIHFYMKENENHNDIERMTFSVVCTLCTINLCMIIGIFPVIGVQMLFTGLSRSFILINAFALGVLTLEHELDEKIVRKIKEVITDVKNHE